MLLNLKQIHQSNAPAGDGVSALLLPFLSVRDNSRQGDEVVNGGSEHGKGGGIQGGQLIQAVDREESTHKEVCRGRVY